MVAAVVRPNKTRFFALPVEPATFQSSFVFILKAGGERGDHEQIWLFDRGLRCRFALIHECRQSLKSIANLDGVIALEAG